MNNQDETQKLRTEVMIGVISSNLDRVSSDVNGIKESLNISMREVSEAIRRLVSLEERVANQNVNLERTLKVVEKAHDKLDDLEVKISNKMERFESRLSALEKEQSTTQLITKWVIGGVIGIVTLVGISAMKLIVN